MKPKISLALIALCCLGAQAKDHARIKVDVIQNVPTTSTYSWQTAGKTSVSCSGSSCSGYYMPPQSGTQALHGAVLKLLLPDGRIVIASCAAKGNAALSMLSVMASQDRNAPLVYRDCRFPSENTTIDAEFDRSTVKLFMRAPSIDGTGKVSSETYYIRGVLEPTASAVGEGHPKAQNQPPKLDELDVEMLQMGTKYSSLKPQAEILNRQTLQLDMLDKRCHGMASLSSKERENCWQLYRPIFVAIQDTLQSFVPLVDETITRLRSNVSNPEESGEVKYLFQMRTKLVAKAQAASFLVAKTDYELAQFNQN